MILNTLRRTQAERRQFDPSDRKDLLALKYFKNNGRWKGSCPFFLEDPYIDVPGMCYHIYSDYMLDRVK